MLLEGSTLPLLIDKAVAPPSSLELHQGKGIWKEDGGAPSVLFRLLLWCESNQNDLGQPSKTPSCLLTQW